MTVKDVLIIAAGNLARSDLAAELTALTSSDTPSDEAASLLRCYRLVESEVALDYYPLENTERFLPILNRVSYTAFSSSPVNIIDVKDENGERVNFSVYASYISVPEDTGEVSVRYTYTPPQGDYSDALPFPARISAQLLSLGVCSEFLLSCGRYAEAAVWEGKFREGLRDVGVFRRKLCAIRARRWV